MPTPINCARCGFESIFEEGEDIKKCKRCKKTVVMKSVQEALEFTPPEREVQKRNLMLALSKETDSGNKDQINLALGLIALSSGAGTVAQVFLKKIIDENPINTEAYYYYSLSLLNGKRPFTQPRTTIDQIIQYMDFAIGLMPEGKYYYLKALLIFDFYESKFLRHPDKYQNLLQTAAAFGVSEQDKSEIFALLNMTKPNKF